MSRWWWHETLYNILSMKQRKTPRGIVPSVHESKVKEWVGEKILQLLKGYRMCILLWSQKRDV